MLFNEDYSEKPPLNDIKISRRFRKDYFLHVSECYTTQYFNTSLFPDNPL